VVDTTGLGKRNNVHPRLKQPVGEKGLRAWLRKEMLRRVRPGQTGF
jgi:hypothetical protein